MATATADSAKSIRTHITPYLCVKGGERALEFYKEAFGAVEIMRVMDDQGRVSHAEFHIGEADVNLADEHPEIGFLSPQTLGRSPVMLNVTVPNVDAFFDRAVAAGATVTRPVADQEYGFRNGGLKDPFGHDWFISTPI